MPKKNNEKLFLQYRFISPSIDKEGVECKIADSQRNNMNTKTNTYGKLLL